MDSPVLDAKPLIATQKPSFRVPSKSSDLTLVATDKILFPVHQSRLMAHSKEFATLLSHISRPEPAAINTYSNPSILLPYDSMTIAFILPYLYDETIPPIVNLTFAEMWPSLDLAVKYNIHRALDAFAEACSRHSEFSATLSDKILAFIVAVALKRHGLMNECFRMVMHHNAHPKVLLAALSKLLRNGDVPKTAGTALKVLYHSAKRRHAHLASLHRSLYKHVKASMASHHALPDKIKCTCNRSASIETWWSIACQAKQHDLKRLVEMYYTKAGHTAPCDEDMKKALSELYIRSEDVEIIRWCN